ncbi:MAG: hypothetical protein R3D02_11845 [Hyphomicrobiales bacterium]
MLRWASSISTTRSIETAEAVRSNADIDLRYRRAVEMAVDVAEQVAGAALRRPSRIDSKQDGAQPFHSTADLVDRDEEIAGKGDRLVVVIALMR